MCGRLDVAASGENRTRPLQCDFSGRESYDANVTVVVGPGRGVQGPVPRSVEHAVRAVAGKPGRGSSWRPVGLLGARPWREAAVDVEGGVLPPPPRVCRRVPALRFSWPPPPEVCVPAPPETSGIFYVGARGRASALQRPVPWAPAPGSPPRPLCTRALPSVPSRGAHRRPAELTLPQHQQEKCVRPKLCSLWEWNRGVRN